ncbi:hypothetical protein [Fodinibius salsisoli]|uniref:Transposase n=1 Tax=Fodinibius salsisoli TaxID=2820877 RepID=A0ABT3PSY2_9BACT|nr:hypothetical protein [Fodinibius salsisoli]MCW9708970.1 hypothetical protein [Fodinibius salsisoli]
MLPSNLVTEVYLKPYNDLANYYAEVARLRRLYISCTRMNVELINNERKGKKPEKWPRRIGGEVLSPIIRESA